MIAGFDGSSLTQGLSGVGYYTSAPAGRSRAAAADSTTCASWSCCRTDPFPFRPRPACACPKHACPVRAAWMELRVPRAPARRPALTSRTSRTTPRRSACDLPYVVTVHDMSLTLLPWCYTWKMRLIVPRVLPRVARRARLVLTSLGRDARRRREAARGSIPGRVRVIPHAAPRGFDPPGPAACFCRPRRTSCSSGTSSRARTWLARCGPSRASHPHSPSTASSSRAQPGWKYDDVLREADAPELAGASRAAGLRARGRAAGALPQRDRVRVPQPLRGLRHARDRGDGLRHAGV